MAIQAADKIYNSNLELITGKQRTRLTGSDILDLRAGGWNIYKYESPSYDPSTQKLGSLTFSGDVVTHTVIPKTTGEIAVEERKAVREQRKVAYAETDKYFFEAYYDDASTALSNWKSAVANVKTQYPLPALVVEYADYDVAKYADLPLDPYDVNGSGEIVAFVQNASGIWPFRKKAGYYRYRNQDWEYYG